MERDGMTFRLGPSYLFALTLVVAGCQQGEVVASSESQTTINAPPGVSIVDSAPTSGPTPPVGSYRQRYLSIAAPLVVHCMNDRGWEATYDPLHGAIIADVSPSQIEERDRTTAFCVAGTRTNRGTHAD